eukprot:gene10086-11762_t
MNNFEIFKALSNKSRLQILQWLKEPELHFPEQESGFEAGFLNIFLCCSGQGSLSLPGSGSGPIIKEMKMPFKH